MSDQPRHTFERHPQYDQRVQQPPTHTVAGLSGPSGGGATGVLLGAAGGALAVATVVLAYAIMRWVDDPLAVFLVVVALAVVVLAVLALLAGRRNALAPFVAIALVLPFFTTVAAAYGLGGRIEDGLESFLGGDGDASFSLGSGDEEESADGAEAATAVGEEGTSGNFTVTVQGVECSASLPEAADNPDYWTEDDAPQYLDATAPQGKHFCVVSSTWSNTSQEPDMVWGGPAKVVTSEGVKYAQTDDDSSFSSRASAQAGYEGDTLNPGDTAELRTVFTLPEDVDPTHTIVEGFGFDEPAVWFELS